MALDDISYALDAPGTVAISVVGSLDPWIAERLGGMKPVPVEGPGGTPITLLIGSIVDQAALVGIINALHNLGVPILSVQRLQAQVSPGTRRA